MANAHATEAWDHTAAILALTFNVNRSAKAKAVKAEDFHPYRQRRIEKMTVEHLHSLKGFFAAEENPKVSP